MGVLGFFFFACHGILRAESLRSCDEQLPLSASQKDQLIRFASVVKTALETSGAQLALVSRSGLDLSRFGQRYSHAGLSLRASEHTPWSIRQLYYACDEARPRIFDQGLAGFVLGLNNPDRGFLSVVLMPKAEADLLESSALNKQTALQALGAQYSANAFAFSTRYQNCNQWVIETMASAWGGLPGGASTRAQAQSWLLDQGYQPSIFDLGWRPLLWLSHLVPWLHSSDHPVDDLENNRFRVSMPASIEQFVRARLPEATRLEFCYRPGRVVMRRGWEPLGDDCEASEADRVVLLD